MEYASADRAYAAEIFNRVIYRNANSHKIKLGRFIVHTIYANGSRPDTYAGNYNSMPTLTSWGGNNAIGVEVIHTYLHDQINISHGYSNVALKVYFDGLGVYYPYEFNCLGWRIHGEINNMVHENFDVIQTTYVEQDRHNMRPRYIIQRKPLCEEYERTYSSTNDFSCFLEQKYNQRRIENADV